MNEKIIIKKLFLLTLLPLIIIVIVLVFSISRAYLEINQFKNVKDISKKTNNLLMLIQELQKERGLVSGYLGNSTKSFKKKVFDQRKRTDIKIQGSLDCCSDNYLAQSRERVSSIRERVDTLSISSSEALHSYTDTIQDIINVLTGMIKDLKNEEIKSKLYFNLTLLAMSESLGQIRGGINGILASKKLNEELIYFIVRAKGEYDYAYNTFGAIAQKEYKNYLQDLVATDEYIFMMHEVQKYGKLKQTVIIENPTEWFVKASVVIDSIYQLKKKLILETNEYIEDYSSVLLQKLYIGVFVMLFASAFILYLGYRIKNDVLKNIKLLNEYKDAVDRSSIVSKTDIKGRITYANKKFCDISGYSQIELLGKPHSIVRDPKVPSKLFAGMWSNLLMGKSWEGVVRNKKKNDGYYTVEVTISPILNHKGEIEEFIAIRNDITELIELQKDIQNTQRDLVYKLGEIGETRSKETGFHVKRVAKYSELLAYYYGLSEIEIANLTNASPMHDIGKIAIPDHILNKPGKLTEDEWNIMKTHSEIGYGLFKDSNKELLRVAAIISYEHHEKYDGTGYPKRLKGENINIMARITALADVFDALGSDRCYKKAWSDEKTFAFIKEQSGKHFDSKLVEIFFEHLEEFLSIRDKYSDKSSFMLEA